MDNQVHNAIVSFIWGIADNCLRDVYVRGKYRDVILPMTVIRRLDAMLDGSKAAVLEMKKKMDAAGITNQWPALCNAAGQAFCNASPFLLKDLTSRAKKQTLKTDFKAYLDGFSPNVQEILDKFKFRNQIDAMIDADILGAVIGKFVSPTINLSPNPVYTDDTMQTIKLPALDNHGKAIYDKNAETILGNMNSVVFLGGREASTIKEISENWLGKATISMQTEGRSRGQSESYNQNTQRLGRELMTPAELATMPGDRCILQLRGLPPFYSKKYDLKHHPNYRYTAEADKKKNAFSLERLINRRMKKLNPDEQYTVYEADVPDKTDIDEDEDILNYDDLDDPDAFV